MTPRRHLGLAAIGLSAALALILGGCTDSSSVQQDLGKNFVSGDGTVMEIQAADRGPSVQFSGTTETGKTLSRKDFDGKVVVLNFWYASCPPCRLEAPDLEALSTKYSRKNVQFIGVNVRDQADTARAFARTFSITYPSIIDTNDAQVQLALAPQRGGANSTPATIILDRKGRYAARITGGANESVLDTLIEDALR